jgi:hypothetical protein
MKLTISTLLATSVLVHHYQKAPLSSLSITSASTSIVSNSENTHLVSHSLRERDTQTGQRSTLSAGIVIGAMAVFPFHFCSLEGSMPLRCWAGEIIHSTVCVILGAWPLDNKII